MVCSPVLPMLCMHAVTCDSGWSQWALMLRSVYWRKVIFTDTWQWCIGCWLWRYSASIIRIGSPNGCICTPSSFGQEPVTSSWAAADPAPPPDLPTAAPAGGPAHPVRAPVQQGTGNTMLSILLSSPGILYLCIYSGSSIFLVCLGLLDVTLVQCGTYSSSDGAERKTLGYFEGILTISKFFFLFFLIHISLDI